ncbi:MAG: putative glycoside hydrolase [Anaerolineae bacterium]
MGRLAALAVILAATLAAVGAVRYLGEKALVGGVRDAASGAPVPAARVAVGDRVELTDRDGRYQVSVSSGPLSVRASADGYLPVEWDLTVEGIWAKTFPLDILLQPTRLELRLINLETGTPVTQATVKEGERLAEMGGGGEFVLWRLSEGSRISIEADGYLPGETVFSGNGAIEVGLLSRRITIQVIDGLTGTPVAGARVLTANEAGEETEAGHYEIDRPVLGETIRIEGDGYEETEMAYGGGSPLVVSLFSREAGIEVRDLYSGAAVPRARVYWQGAILTLDRAGRVLVRGIGIGDVVTVEATGYRPTEATYGGEAVLAVTLRPEGGAGGLVAEAVTGNPVAGARVYARGQVVLTDAQGLYLVEGLSAGDSMIVLAPGYRRAEGTASEQGLDFQLQPLQVKGLYINLAILGQPAQFYGLLDLAARTDLNAVVVDVKGDGGLLAWPSSVSLARELGAAAGGLLDLGEVVDAAHSRGLYVIARQVVFKDPILASARPDLVVRLVATGEPFADYGGGWWVDPFSEEVWEYNVALAEEVSGFGFDEIQVDYIRFPSNGIKAAELEYSRLSTPEDRVVAIEGFMARLRQRLARQPVFLSADIFGLTPWVTHDMGIGQKVENVAPHVDYISPMLYPSTYGPGNLGYENPALYPYEVVYRSILEAKKRTDVLIRPWLQQYSLPPNYGLAEYQAQREAAEAAASFGWLFWNARGAYEEELFAPTP